MNDLQRLLIADGVQGGVLAQYEAKFRKFVDVRLGELGAQGFAKLAHDLLNASYFLGGVNEKQVFALSQLASRASIAHTRRETL